MKPALVAVAAALALAACHRDRGRDHERRGGVASAQEERDRQDRAGTTTLTGASWVANATAIDRIVASRCAREVSCNNIGVDRRFFSNELCVREVRPRLEQDLSPSECPAGIDGNELDECLDAIRNESCTNPVDAVARLAACRTGDLCLKAVMPPR